MNEQVTGNTSLDNTSKNADYTSLDEATSNWLKQLQSIWNHCKFFLPFSKTHLNYCINLSIDFREKKYTSF